MRINADTILLYQESRIYSNNSLFIYNGKFVINWNNSFYPIFYYRNNNVEVLTPNYSHLFNLNLPLSVNYNSIKEFIIFNTTLKDNTFHNEVNRLFGVKNIILQKDSIQLDKHKENEIINNIFDIFNENIKKIIGQTDNDIHGIFLSGGNESRINAAIGNHYNLNRKFITWGHPKDKEFIIASNIARKSKVEHINIRPNLAELPYKDFFEKTGFLSNIQYAYRHQNVKLAFEKLKIDHLWSGWGDTTGYIPINQSTEFFNDIFWNYTKEQTINSPFWNKDFLSSYEMDVLNIPPQKDRYNFLGFLFRFYHKEIAPHIYGQVFAAENMLGNVITPWFYNKLYKSIFSLESKQPSLYLNKTTRVLWKNNLYTKIIAQYDTKLNYMKNAKNYYPFLFSDYIKYGGLPVAYFLQKFKNDKTQYFDPVEDRLFIKSELQKIINSENILVNKNNLKKFVKSGMEVYNGSI
ncbi:MAG: hypothetical protein IPJ03_00045 [Ignavibacteriales bacterium]|nr:hypothetical protein [Ignavibacteriales bacterium]